MKNSDHDLFDIEVNNGKTYLFGREHEIIIIPKATEILGLRTFIALNTPYTMFEKSVMLRRFCRR